jgi:hypothetical protein
MTPILWVSQSACRRLLTVLAEDRLVARCLHKLRNTDKRKVYNHGSERETEREREIKAHYPSDGLEEDSIHLISALQGNEKTDLSLRYHKNSNFIGCVLRFRTSEWHICITGG